MAPELQHQIEHANNPKLGRESVPPREKAAQGREDTSKAKGVAGPFLQFLGCSPEQGCWRGSVLYLTRAGSAPTLTFTLEGNGSKTLKPEQLDEHLGWCYWRWTLELPVTAQEQVVKYSIQNSAGAPANSTFYIAGAEQPWHWGFYSCNGLSSDADPKVYGGKREFALWSDVLAKHAAKPMHVMFGGGDQIYNDDIFEIDILQRWLQSGEKGMEQAPFTPEMESEVLNWYLEHYRQHFSSDYLADAWACIPQACTWDDHDIFDGWGSYPPKLHASPVFQGVFRCARKVYLLYQHHTTIEKATQENDLWGPVKDGQQIGYSWLRMLGTTTAVIAPEQRAERRRDQVISPETYDMMFQRLEALPKTVRHLIVIVTVPITFPALPAQEPVFFFLSRPAIANFLKRTGLAEKLLNHFGQADLLDDILDHWDASVHHKERGIFIKQLQKLSKKKLLRTTFLGGDVHCCGIGRMYTTPKLRKLRYDHRFMTQITSSAIANGPPPPTFVNLLQKTNRSHLVVKPATRAKMLRLFKPKHPDSPKLLGFRNWLEVQEIPATPAQLHELQDRHNPIHDDTPGSLVCSLRVEEEGPKDASDKPPRVTPYNTVIPVLMDSPDRKDRRVRSWVSRFTCSHTPYNELTTEL